MKFKEIQDLWRKCKKSVSGKSETETFQKQTDSVQGNTTVPKQKIKIQFPGPENKNH